MAQAGALRPSCSGQRRSQGLVLSPFGLSQGPHPPQLLFSPALSVLTRDHLGSLHCVSLTEKSLVTGTGLRLGLEGSEAENSGIRPRTGSMHMLDGGGGMEVAL